MITTRLDNFETAFFARELEYLESQTYDILYPELKATQLIPVKSTAGAGAEANIYQQFDKVGTAKFVSDYAKDFPRADVKGREYRDPIRSIGASFGYSFQEIKAAAFAGRSLETMKAEAARRVIEQKINDTGFFGSEEFGLTGFFNNTEVTRVASPQNSGTTSRAWADKTPTEILADMNSLANGIITDTLGVENPNTILLPIDQYTLISTTNAGTGTDTTILQYFLSNSPTITRVEWVNEAKAAGLGVGAVPAGESIMVAYNLNPNKLSFIIPMPFEMFPPEQERMSYVVSCHARVSSVAMYYPKSVAIMEGI